MLDSKTIEIVKSTAPVLQEHSHAIGVRFYELLFTKAPSLYNIFNQTNQKRGIQQDALAYSVYMAGKHIDNLDAVKGMVERVTEKHRALGVKAEQYPIVGETLLEAVKDVLGDGVNDEIIEAWGKAYQEIADIFISIENELYEQVEQEVGGWTGLRSFVIDQKVKESDVITSFYLKAQDGGPIPTYQAGQYLTLQVDIEGDQYSHMRHYTISDAPGKDYYRISVKREEGSTEVPDGKVSNYLHHQVGEGDVLQVTAPAGEFTVSTEEMPLVLISGGVGITPMMSMLKDTIKENPEREITFIHAAQNSNVHALQQEVLEISKQYDNVTSYLVYSEPTAQDRADDRFDREGFIEKEWLQGILEDNQKDFYFCGPVPFMKVVNNALKEWGVPAERRQFEAFSPVSTIEA
ncbi:NO-inducible flavohemoprotein [Pontibacillus yanchengensis]|uniref:Flavohemoprotein n=1 Tax=Pontibacillus yanchengensis Y32 TaxID=1385514 RepID=A0A0A2TJC0_9BACI|nr:NO-inducible flavohemoprotein [Pontibacillus yanchengensis]KGP74538.1 dihydropteridine reductase [Pontibacillus yanchengensis Y32]